MITGPSVVIPHMSSDLRIIFATPDSTFLRPLSTSYIFPMLLPRSALAFELRGSGDVQDFHSQPPNRSSRAAVAHDAKSISAPRAAHDGAQRQPLADAARNSSATTFPPRFSMMPPCE